MIKYFITDCDGVLTDGKYYYSKCGKEFVTFHANDSVAFNELKSLGVEVIMISSGNYQEINRARARDLGVMFIHAPFGEKVDTVLSIGLDINEVAYVGDCSDDVGMLQIAGISFAPNSSLPQIKEKAKIVTSRGGGEGCILEIVFILKNLGLL